MIKRRFIILGGLSIFAITLGVIAFKPSSINNELNDYKGNVLEPHIVKAETMSDATSNIQGHNLSLEDSVNIVYYVNNSNATNADEKGLLIWKSYQDTYTIGSQDYKITNYSKETIASIDYDVFYFNRVAAKQMTDYFYSVSYVRFNDTYIYSSVDRYSILDYCYHYKDSSLKVNEDSQVSIGSLVSSILLYGANSQLTFNYHTDRLANSNYYSISLTGGHLDDGFTSGLYSNSETFYINTDYDCFDLTSWNDGSNDIGNDYRQVITGLNTSKSITANYAVTPMPETEGLAYTLSNDGTYYILSGIGSADPNTEEIVVYGTHNGLPVKEVAAKAFDVNRIVKKIYLPNTVETIGRCAFALCQSASYIRVSPFVKSVGADAFYCTALVEACLPSLEEHNIYYYLDATFDTLKKLTIYGGTSIITDALKDDYYRELETLVLPNTIKTINDNAFEMCRSLKYIYMQEGLLSIGNKAFSYCGSLTDFYLPGTVTHIGDKCFENCTCNVKYNGTKEQFKAIEKGSEWKGDLLFIYFNDGTYSSISWLS